MMMNSLTRRSYKRFASSQWLVCLWASKLSKTQTKSLKNHLLCLHGMTSRRTVWRTWSLTLIKQTHHPSKLDEPEDMRKVWALTQTPSSKTHWTLLWHRKALIQKVRTHCLFPSLCTKTCRLLKSILRSLSKRKTSRSTEFCTISILWRNVI